MPSSLPFDRVADRYDTTRGGAPRGRHTAAAFERWLPSGPIVELGVGTGVISAALTDERRRPVGLDLSAPMLVNAAERLPGRLAQGDVLSPPVRHGAVAAVIAVHVLHLVTDLGAAVGAAASLLRAGGRFLISGIDGNRESDDELAAIDAALPVRLRPIRQPQRAEIIEFGRTHGLVLLHDGRMPRRTFTQSPANAADLLETRAWSWCWDLPDDVWTAEVVPVIEALRALPEAHRPRQRWVEWRYLVLEATPRPP
jgi:SAM-dependent methyltransferase